MTDNQSASKQINQTKKTLQILALCLCFTFSTKCNVMCCKASKTHHLPLITPSLLLPFFLSFSLSLLSSPHHSINSQHLQHHHHQQHKKQKHIFNTSICPFALWYKHNTVTRLLLWSLVQESSLTA